MRVVVTRPQPDGDRTAAALRARGHEVLLAPLMRAEPVPATLAGTFAGIVITSANAPRAVADHSRIGTLVSLPVFAVGARTAEAAREAGFKNVVSADGDAKDLVRLIAARCGNRSVPLLYLAGRDRAADIGAELSAHGVKIHTEVVYRAVTLPFLPALLAALKAREVDAVLHFSARSAENYLAGARDAGLLDAALAPRQLCLSAHVAAPISAAGTANVAIATRPDEAALLELLGTAKG
jgi:uroporphyrinogen-III synthase